MTDYFIREYELEDGETKIILHQANIGDVNCVVWDAALVLAKYLELQHSKNKDFTFGKNILELGSGPGLVGLTAAILGGNVTLTDLPEYLNLLEKNIEQNNKIIGKNNGRAEARALDWKSETDVGNVDILLLADCVYYKDSIQPLIDTLQRLSTKETIIFLSQEKRDHSAVQSAIWKEFYLVLEKNFVVTEIPLIEQHSLYNSSDITLLMLKKL